jgi:hypothetical protein
VYVLPIDDCFNEVFPNPKHVPMVAGGMDAGRFDSNVIDLRA